MRAAEGQKWSYVEMILNSEVEEKLRCDFGGKKNEGKSGRNGPRPVVGKGETISKCRMKPLG